jgi:hypothetical protein
VRSDERDRIVSFGVSMTNLGRTVGLADGEHDQGQYDGSEDVLGADVRGILVRADAWTALGASTALSRGGRRLDLGVRARLRGGRVASHPARSSPSPPGRWRRCARVRGSHGATASSALLRRRAAVPLHWLTLLPLALLRSLAALLGKRPGQILPEWGAAATAMVRPAAVARTRRGIRSHRAASWAQIAPLRVTATQLRHRLDDDLPVGAGRGELHFFSGGGAWIVLGALVVSVVSFVSLLAWPVLGGGALAPCAERSRGSGRMPHPERARSAGTRPVPQTRSAPSWRSSARCRPQPLPRARRAVGARAAARGPRRLVRRDAVQ